ncbi:MAG TPA: KEOPS complex N(6)-L-threonylcarbamoyladenine synthase Kae1 [Nitrososphaeraceae archaeon]|nr:KEOPS complex N(6)-L-threonylcarbamoyladenine synthase Kae1 [Nitrososphaeraceae archaeon]
MLALGIESTAHTFGCAITEIQRDDKASFRILSDVRSSYEPPKGSGIHPREASIHHANVSSKILKEALALSSLELEQIDIIGYSAGPGLGPCLRIGAVLARLLSAYYKKPLVPVNHALAHIELGARLTGAKDPMVVLVSGGHTMILLFFNKRWRIFGETLDITLGQLFDQFGRSLGFSSPCGPMIEKLASNSGGGYSWIPYTIKGNDVSFSGLLTAAIKRYKDERFDVGDTCYSLQETAFAILAEATERAIAFTNKKEVVVVGGVAANKRLADMLTHVCARHGSKMHVCPIHYAGDNGVQIALTSSVDHLHTRLSVSPENGFINQAWRLDSVEVTWR